jgi:hypothetical protein
MRIDKGEGKLYFFKSLYEEARTAMEALFAQMQKNVDQYKGDTAIDGSDFRATHVRNITYELVESQVSGHIPVPKVTPKAWSERNERNAISIENFLKAKRNELPFEAQNDIDERYAPVYGGSVWISEWDESITTQTTVGDLRINCFSPPRFTGQPNIFDVQNMEYCFVEYETSRDDIVRRYGVSPEIADETESKDHTDDKTATVYTCLYKDDDDRICRYVWSGDTELEDIDDFYSRKVYVCTRCNKKKQICTCEENGEKPKYELQNEEYEELDHDIVRSDGSVIPAMSPVIKDGQIVTEMQKQMAIDELTGEPIIDVVGGVPVPRMIEVPVPVLEPTRIPYYRPKLFPISIRKNTSQEDSLFGQSDCEFIRPQQQAINKVESRIIDKVMRSGVYPIVPDSYNGNLSNSVFGQVLRATHDTYNLYGRVDMQVDISRDIAEAERLYDHAKRILGISDSYQGQADNTASSGIAKQLQINQSAGRLDSKRRMKNSAYAELDRIMFEFALAYADEPRPASYVDALGRRHNAQFNRYDFVERDESGAYYYNDEYLFSTDSTVDIEADRATMWAENLKNFQIGAYGNPADPRTLLLYWMNMERMHYPYASENVQRIQYEIEQMQMQAKMKARAESAEKDVKNHEGYEEYLRSLIGG